MMEFYYFTEGICHLNLTLDFAWLNGREINVTFKGLNKNFVE